MNASSENCFKDYTSIEKWFQDQSPDSFPIVDSRKGEKAFLDKYFDLKQGLIPVHDEVEKGALYASVQEWRHDIEARIEELKVKAQKAPSDEINDEIARLLEVIKQDPTVYLTHHGVGHIDRVAKRAFEIIRRFTNGIPTPSEAFLLLCAIQLHDTGNLKGREDHQTNIPAAALAQLERCVPDTVTRRLIRKIAIAHGGKIDGNADTITASQLRLCGRWFELPIREQMLAALLRFSDELSDDSSRVVSQPLETQEISENSRICFEYSKSLHTVVIEENSINKTLFLVLEYYVDSSIVKERFLKNGKKELLLDEIFNRTIKVERERRYCMRYLGQYLPLVEIIVRIEIIPANDTITEPQVYTYTLKENGYPSSKIEIDCPYNTGDKIIDNLDAKGWLTK